MSRHTQMHREQRFRSASQSGCETLGPRQQGGNLHHQEAPASWHAICNRYHDEKTRAPSAHCLELVARTQQKMFVALLTDEEILYRQLSINVAVLSVAFAMVQFFSL